MAKKEDKKKVEKTKTFGETRLAFIAEQKKKAAKK